MTWEQLIEEVKAFDKIQISSNKCYIQHNGLVFCNDLSIAAVTEPYGDLTKVGDAKSIYHMKKIILALTDGIAKQENKNGI